MAKYKYTGSDEKNFPTLGVTVNNGDVITANVEINHPEFELVVESEPQNQPAEEPQANESQEPAPEATESTEPQEQIEERIENI